MRLWVLTFDEPRFEEESPQLFSWGDARHATAEDIDEEMVERAAKALAMRAGYRLPGHRAKARAVLEAALTRKGE